MRILSKYILREHVAPFVFAMSALTFVVLLNEIGQRFSDLLGKGLAWNVIVEVFALSIPYIVAMTLPMAVLIAVLYAFNRLAGDNEITAMKANGVHLPRLLTPLLACAAILAVGMVWFNDSVLPESNHRLAILLTDIAQKKPTFSLRERAVNEVVPGKLHLQAGRIDQPRSALLDVAIYDDRDPSRSRTVYADSAHMAYSTDRTDLYLTLHDGVMHTVEPRRPESFQRIFFRRDVMLIPDVTNRLERGGADDYRGDRELSIGEMRHRADSALAEADQLRLMSRAFSVAVTRRLLGLDVDTTGAGYVETLPGGAATATGRGRAGSDGADADAEAAPAGAAGAETDTPRDGAAGAEVDTGRRAAGGAAPAADTAFLRELRISLRAADRFDNTSSVRSRYASFASQTDAALETRSRYAVEIQKKYAIPVACIVFVLIGAPIAVRYPLGGVGMVVGVSFGFFCAYYVSLVGGEELADRLILSPFWAMWTPNILFGLVGLFFAWRSVKVG